MASTLPPILVEIQADVASLKKGLDDAKNAINGLSDNVKTGEQSMTRFMDKIKQVGATIGVTFAASQVVSFFRESINAANEASAAQERLSHLLLTTNGGTREQIDALIGQAEALEAVGVVSKDNIITAQSQLATFDLQASTIKTLTPAILDYVTAEKGAAASADDFKGMTNSLAQALNGNFASLTKVGFVLDDATKKLISTGTESERAAAIVDVLNSTYKGFNESLRDTNPLQVARNEFQNLKEDIGEALLPYIDKLSKFITDQLIPGFRKLAKFIKDNADAIKAFTLTLAAGYAAMKLYRGIMILTTAATKAYQVAMVLLKGGQLASIASTNTLAASMLRLNAVMRANPIGIIITVVGLLVAAIVTLWKKSETFRNIVISVGKAGLNAFASIIPMVSKVFEAIAKVVTGPMRAFLGVLSKLPGVGKYAKAGLDFINKGLDGISDMGEKAAAKAKELSAKLDEMGKKAKDNGKKVKEATDPFAGSGKGGKGGGLGEKEKEKLEGYKKKVKDIYKDMNDTIADANEKAAEALERRNERFAEAHERYNERVADLNERYNEQIADAEERHAEQVADLKARYSEEMLEAQKRYDAAEQTARKRNADNIIKITRDFNEKRRQLEIAHEEKIADLRQKAIEKSADLTRKAAEKQASIIQQSMDRLTGAFASGTAVSITDAFKKGQEGGGIAGTLKKQLDDVKRLQEAAGFLAGQGYSQTFIEQVVKAGPEVGLQLTEELKKASPEQQSEIQKTFAELEKISDSGLDDLAKSMNNGANLATNELRKAYDQVAIDLKESLAEVDRELTENMAEQQRDFNRAMTEAMAARDEAIANSFAEMTEAIANAQAELLEAQTKAKENLDKGLAKAAEDLAKSRLKAQEELNKGLAQAQKDLQKALIDAQKDYEKAIDDINKATQKKLDDLKAKLAEVAAAMAALGAAQAAASALANAPVYTPVTPAMGAVQRGEYVNAPSTSTTVNVTGINLTSPNQTASSVVSAIKFGNVVVPTAPTALAAKESGAIGAASIAARTTTTKLDPSYIAMRAR